MVFKWSFKGVSREFQGYFKKFIECFKKISKVCQGSFKVISRKLEGCLKFRDDSKHVSRKTKECFKEDQRVCLGKPKIVSRKTKECFKEDRRVFQGSFKGVSMVFQGVSYSKKRGKSTYPPQPSVPS